MLTVREQIKPNDDMGHVLLFEMVQYRIDGVEKLIAPRMTDEAGCCSYHLGIVLPEMFTKGFCGCRLYYALADIGRCVIDEGVTATTIFGYEVF